MGKLIRYSQVAESFPDYSEMAPSGNGEWVDADECFARIAELEAELETVNSLLDMKREREQHWSDEAWRYKNMNEQLRAERETT